MAINYQQLAQAGSLLSSLSGQSITPTKREIITVSGLQEAKDFRLEKSESVAIIDSNSNILYVKECDEIGKVSLKIFECIDITEKYQLQNTPANISKAEFENLRQDILDLKSLLIGVNNGKHDVKTQNKQQ